MKYTEFSVENYGVLVRREAVDTPFKVTAPSPKNLNGMRRRFDTLAAPCYRSASGILTADGIIIAVDTDEFRAFSEGFHLIADLQARIFMPTWWERETNFSDMRVLLTMASLKKIMENGEVFTGKLDSAYYNVEAYTSLEFGKILEIYNEQPEKV